MLRQNFATALASGCLPLRTDIAPSREAGNAIIKAVLAATSYVESIVRDQSNVLCQTLDDILYPENTRPFHTDNGLFFSECAVMTLAYENYMLGANPMNPLPLGGVLDGMAKEVVLRVLAATYMTYGLGDTVHPDFQTEYVVRRELNREVMAKARAFFEQPAEMRDKAYPAMMDRYREGNLRSDNAVTSSITGPGELTGISKNPLPIGEDPVKDIDKLGDNVFDDVRQRTEDDERAQQRQMEKTAEALNRRETHASKLKLSSSDSEQSTERLRSIPKTVDLIAEMKASWGSDPEVSRETDPFDDMDGYGPIIEEFEDDEPNVARIESTPRASVHSSENKGTDMSYQRHRPVPPQATVHSGHDQRGTLSHVHQTAQQQTHGGHMHTPYHQPRSFIVIDIDNREILDASNRPFALPEEIYPQVPVAHAADAYGRPDFYSDGKPVLVYEQSPNVWAEWTPEIDRRLAAQHHRPPAQQVSGRDMGQAAGQVFQKSARPPAASGDLPASMAAVADRANRRRQNLSQHIMAQQPAPQPEPQAPVDYVESELPQGYFYGDIPLRMHDGEIVYAVPLDKARFRAPDEESFGGMYNGSDSHAVLIALVGDRAFEIIVLKEKLMERQNHVQYEDYIPLEKGEGRKTDIQNIIERPDTKPFSVEYQKDTILDGVDLVETATQALMQSEGDGGLNLYKYETQEVPMSGPVPLEIMEEYRKLQLDEDTTPSDAIRHLAHALKETGVKGLGIWLNRRLAQWSEATIRYRLSKTNESISTTDFTDDFEPMLKYLVTNKLDAEFFDLMDKEIFDYIDLNVVTWKEDDEDSEDSLAHPWSVRCTHEGYILPLHDCETMLSRGRIVYETMPTMYRALAGAFKEKDRQGDTGQWLRVALSTGQWALVLRVGKEMPQFYVVDTFPVAA